jgi:hypothetical protein
VSGREKSYLDNGSRNARLATVAANALLLGLGDDGPGVRRLHRVETREVAAAAAAGAAGIAVGRDVAGAARLDVVVGDVAPVRGLVPERVAVDARAGDLAGDLEIGALGVRLDDLVAGARARAAVEGVGLDGVGADHGHSGREGDSEERKLHDEDCGRCWMEGAVLNWCWLRLALERRLSGCAEKGVRKKRHPQIFMFP